ncbi:hypothetical protein Dimus_035156 [Dionaea muscipula]
MADHDHELIQFQAGGICGGGGGAWWSNPMLGFFSGAGGLPSPCSAALADFGWLNHEMGSIKEKSADYFWEESILVSTDSMSSNDPAPPQASPDPLLAHQPEYGGASGGALTTDSVLQIMGFGLSPSSSTTDWNQHTFIGTGNKGAGDEGKHNLMLQEDHMDSRLMMDYGEAENDDDNIVIINKYYSTFTGAGINHHQAADYPNSSVDSTTTCDGGGSLPEPSFPMSPSAISYAQLVQSLLESDDHQLQLSMPYNDSDINTWLRVSQQVNYDHGTDSISDPSLININYSSMINDLRDNMLNVPSLSSTDERPHGTNLKTKKKNAENVQAGMGLNVTNSNKNEPPFKKTRVETPSPLPTFKVRKEKLGDRITALQQLVSPFGKTDTASVLHEAIEYVKFLHDQVNALSTPYLKNGSPIQHQQLQEKHERSQSQQDLTSRGLCLVPISFTFPVAHETPVDFWTPTFGPTPTFRQLAS